MRAPPTLPGLDLAVVSRLKPRVVTPKTGAGRVRKGARVEREIAELHAAVGVIARRVPLSGALGRRLGADWGGDLKIHAFGDDQPPLTAEVKARAAGTGFLTLERWIGSHEVLILKRNNALPTVVLPWATWTRLIGRGRA